MSNSTDPEEKERDAASEMRKVITTSISVISFIAGVAALVFVISGSFERPSDMADFFSYEIDSLESSLDNLDEDVDEIKQRLKALEETDPTTDAGRQISLFRSELQAFHNRLETLEKGLLDTPQKALSMPLLRNDLENLKKTYNEDIEVMAKNIDRVYDQNKWFIGLMFTMAVGLIGLAISNFLQAKR
jgi:predicted PurR-regulated permease PerM